MERSVFPKPLHEELLDMSLADQEMRLRAQSDTNAWDDTQDQRNTARLKEIIAEIGWPTISKVGADASYAAWVLVQHAYAEPEFMQSCLDLMKQAGEGEVALPNIALLEDRLLVMNQLPQLYGTQFRRDGDSWQPHPIADPENVDARRLAMGLDTLAENHAAILAIHG